MISYEAIPDTIVESLWWHLSLRRYFPRFCGNKAAEFNTSLNEDGNGAYGHSFSLAPTPVDLRALAELRRT